MSMLERFAQLANLTFVDNEVSVGVASASFRAANTERVAWIFTNQSVNRIVVRPYKSITNRMQY